MAVTYEQVKAALDPEEPAYTRAANELGEAALPHLSRLIAGDHPMLASKAAYLAGLIGTAGAADVLHRAARSTSARVRVAAAAAAAKLPADHASDVLVDLVDDNDAGVQKVAIKSVPDGASDVLVARVASLGGGLADTVVRTLAREVMARLPAPTGGPDVADAATEAAPAKKPRKRKK